MENKQDFIEKRTKKLNETEGKLLNLINSEKSEVKKFIDDTITKMNENIAKIEQKRVLLSDVYHDLSNFREKINYYKKGIYKKYFEKIYIYDLESSNYTLDGIKKEIENGLDTLEYYEDTIRLHKFIVDVIKKSITNACKQVLSGLEKLNKYYSDSSKSVNDKIGKEIINAKNIQMKEANEIYEGKWKDIEKKIYNELSKTFDEIMKI